MGDLRFEVDAEGVALVTLDRPERMNAFSPAMGEALGRAFRRCDEDDGVRAVVLTGAGRAFCSGADLSDPAATFDLSGLDMGGAKPSAASLETTNSPSPMADLSLDMGGGGGGGGDDAAAGTKLELAKAYLEIGDKDLARDILQEVAKEDSAAQKEEAEKLIASL